MGHGTLDIDLEALQALESSLDLDEVFSVLSNTYARYTLYYLSDEPTTTLDQLADVVTGVEATVDDAIATPTDREHVEIHLYHVVLPKLEDIGYIDFDSEGGIVTRTMVPPKVYTLLRSGHKPETDGRN